MLVKNILILAHCVLKLQSLEFHTCTYLGFEISMFILAKRPESPYTRYTCTMFAQLLIHNRAAANGNGGSLSCLCQCVAALIVGELLLRLYRSMVYVRQWRLSV